MGISVGVDLSGINIVNAAMEAGGVRGLTRAAHRLRAISVPMTPIDQGDLRSGTTVVPAVSTSQGSKVHNDMVYAARQHEELGWSHPRGGQAKFLEQPAFDNAAELYEIVAADIRRAIR